MKTLFVYVREKDQNDPEKIAKLFKGPDEKEMVIRAWSDSKGIIICIGSLFMPKIKIITVEQCKEYYFIVCNVIGDANRLEIVLSDTKVAVYLPKKNILRIFKEEGGGWVPIYENNNGYICRDQVALCDDDIGYWSN